MEIYSIRWTIEVFFREAKQQLGLGKCKSRDFDAQIASITYLHITVGPTITRRWEAYLPLSKTMFTKKTLLNDSGNSSMSFY